MADERTEPTDAPTAPSSLELLETPHFRSRTPRDDGGHSGSAMEARIRERLLGIPAQVQRIGRFRVVKELGRGGSGRVLECLDEQLDRTIAVKLLREAGHDVAGIRREAMAIARVQHPRVVHVYEVGEHAGMTFLAMQLIRGRPLRQVQRSGLPWHGVLRLYVEAGKGLAAAHAAGIIHRDFKPDNVVVDDDGNPYVLDFGLAQSSPTQDPEQAAITRSHRSRHPGTPSYMAPEQLAGGVADERSDQFAFAAALFEALYGVAAYAGTATFELARAMSRREIHKPPSDHPAPARVHAVLARALACPPDERWPTLRELLAELERVLAEAANVRPRSWWKRAAVLIAIVVVGLAIVLAARE